MKTIKFEIKLTSFEHDLLVAAKSDQPNPERIKALLIADARSTLRRVIDNVDQERNRRFADKSVPTHGIYGERLPPLKNKPRATLGKRQRAREINKLLTANDRRRQRDQRAVDKLTLSRSTRERKPNHSDRSSMPGRGE